jgi:threonine synthase
MRDIAHCAMFAAGYIGHQMSRHAGGRSAEMSSVLASVTSMVCEGCGTTIAPEDPRPFRCPNAGRDDIDHVVRRRIDTSGLLEAFHDREPDPFIRYRKLTHAWHTAMALGMRDAEVIDIVRRLEEGIGAPFRVTPLYEQNTLAHTIDLQADLWVKNETRNIGGSHEARHLMGIAIWLMVAERLDPSIGRQRLATMASSGNGAVVAALLAHAMRRPLDIFVPADADTSGLESLGAVIRPCQRTPGVPGNPAYLRFREAVACGAIPFTGQGNENALAIEGGETLAWEMISQLMSNRSALDRLFIQVGGGALASSCIAAFDDAGIQLPRIHAVQTLASPLKRAWDRIRDVDQAILHRSEVMWPWEPPHRSVASGILDDETYDWAAVIRGMKRSRGEPIVVSEERLLEANRIASSATQIVSSPTGSAGFAGLLEYHRYIERDEAVGVIFTG